MLNRRPASASKSALLFPAYRQVGLLLSFAEAKKVGNGSGDQQQHEDGSAVKTAGGLEKLKAALMKRRLLLI
jgi:hypothetical protein